MNGAATETQSPMLPSTAKHVNYTLGMVLGVDDFVQEFTYHDGRRQAFARELIGYGTVVGLQVSVQSDARGPRVMVAPGVALSPRGQTIRVCAAQCAYLQDWLNDHRNTILQRLGSPPDDAITAHLALCYRDCTSDPVPIPGEPCRRAEDMTASSRLVDDFRLELRFDPPEQHEEDALRAFVDWLVLVPIGGASPGSSLDEFLAAIRAAALEMTSPPGAPLFSHGSPPPSLRIAASDACEFLRAAFRVWVTEMRPRVLGASVGCCSKATTAASPEECVWLGEVSVPVLVNELEGQLELDTTRTVTIDEEARPFVVHLRMLQEWLLCGRSAGVGVAAAARQQHRRRGQRRGYLHSFSHTETCERLEATYGVRSHHSTRSRSRSPASWAIRSSSAGHA